MNEEALAADNERLAREVRDAQDKVLATTATDDELRVRYANDRHLRDEFRSLDAFMAYMHYQERVAKSKGFQRALAAV